MKAIPLEAKLLRRTDLTEDVFELEFESNPGFTYESGQFVSVIIPGKGPGGRDLRRAYSISSVPELAPARFELCVKLVPNGPGTNYLNALKVGDSIKGLAPYGDFTFKTLPQRKAVFIATGTGIAPFRSMVFGKSFRENQARVASAHLLFGARVASEALYLDEFREILGKDRVVFALSREQQEGAFSGRVTDWLRQQDQSFPWKETDFYLCGNGAMIEEVKTILLSHGVEKSAIHQEVYYKPKAGETHASN